MKKLHFAMALVTGLGLLAFAPDASAQNLACADICACIDADGDGVENDYVCCLETGEGETPVVSDLQNDGDACGCAEIGPAALIAGRISDQTAVKGCSQVNGAVASTLDPQGAEPVAVPATEEQCRKTAAEACATGNPDTCYSVIRDADDEGQQCAS